MSELEVELQELKLQNAAMKKAIIKHCMLCWHCVEGGSRKCKVCCHLHDALPEFKEYLGDFNKMKVMDK